MPLDTSHFLENEGGQHREPTATRSLAVGLGDLAGTFQCVQPPHFVKPDPGEVLRLPTNPPGRGLGSRVF